MEVEESRGSAQVPMMARAGSIVLRAVDELAMPGLSKKLKAHELLELDSS